jgi:hypothetical protein
MRNPNDWEFTENDWVVDMRANFPWPFLVIDHGADTYLLLPDKTLYCKDCAIARPKDEVEQNYILIVKEGVEDA